MSHITHQLERIIHSKRLSHTYMFEGDAIETLSRYAKHFASMILGNDDRTLDLINARNHPDYYYLSTDEKTIKKEAVEHLVHVMNKKPTASQYKVYIIEAFEKLTEQAENSLLKFLEEPPKNTIALLLTTDKSRILSTIHSRSQHIYIKGEARDRVERLTTLTEQERHTVNVLMLNSNHIEDLEENFKELYLKAVEFSKRWLSQHPMTLLSIKPMLNVANESRDYVLLLKLIDGYIRQKLHESYGLVDYKPFLNASKSTHSQAQLIRMLEEIQTANRLLSFNVNPTLVFESMVICSKG